MSVVTAIGVERPGVVRKLVADLVPEREYPALIGRLHLGDDAAWVRTQAAVHGPHPSPVLDLAPHSIHRPGGSRVGNSVGRIPNVTILTPLAMRTHAQLRRHLEQEGPAGIKVLPFFCMTDPRKSLHRQVCDTVDARRSPPAPATARPRGPTVPSGVRWGNMLTWRRIWWAVSAEESIRRR